MKTSTLARYRADFLKQSTAAFVPDYVGTMRGRVISAAGTPLTHVFVYVWLRTSETRVSMSGSFTRPDRSGNYVFDAQLMSTGYPPTAVPDTIRATVRVVDADSHGPTTTVLAIDSVLITLVPRGRTPPASTLNLRASNP
jgi:hypothetical protein